MKTATKRSKGPKIETAEQAGKLVAETAQNLAKLAEVDKDEFNAACRIINGFLKGHAEAGISPLLTQPDLSGAVLDKLESCSAALEGFSELLWGDHKHNPLEAEHIHELIMPHLKALREARQGITDFFDAQHEWEARYKKTDTAEGAQ
jgi:Spy/CpxP family protein refolding chaperone